MDLSRQKRKLIIILGTTAVGKTKLSIQLSKQLTEYFASQQNTLGATNTKDHVTEIISADSVQVYKGLEICSDAITAGTLQFDNVK